LINLYHNVTGQTGPFSGRAKKGPFLLVAGYFNNKFNVLKGGHCIKEPFEKWPIFLLIKSTT